MTTKPLGPAAPTHLQANLQVALDRKRSSLERLSAVKSVDVNLHDLERTLVLAARNEGVIWKEIGLRLGITTQAAQQRFGVGGELR